MLTGTSGELYAVRAAWRAVAAAAEAMGRCGLDPQFAATLRERAAALGRERFAITLPCMLCRQPQPVDVQVGGLDGQQDATPGNVVCGACNAQVEAAMTRARDGR